MSGVFLEKAYHLKVQGQCKLGEDRSKYLVLTLQNLKYVYI